MFKELQKNGHSIDCRLRSRAEVIRRPKRLVVLRNKTSAYENVRHFTLGTWNCQSAEL